jgi:hypothetical protein
LLSINVQRVTNKATSSFNFLDDFFCQNFVRDVCDSGVVLNIDGSRERGKWRIVAAEEEEEIADVFV